MTLRIEPIWLDSTDDSEAVLVFHDDRLAAVACKLGELHEDRAGRWFVEATFGDDLAPSARSDFSDLADLEAWIVERWLPPIR